eukprot:4256617-Pyramimonas_sp.AAC.1
MTAAGLVASAAASASSYASRSTSPPVRAPSARLQGSAYGHTLFPHEANSPPGNSISRLFF